MYGFARFRNVNDMRIMAMKLDIIMINKWKIYVNILRFNRGEGNNQVHLQKKVIEDSLQTTQELRKQQGGTKSQ